MPTVAKVAQDPRIIARLQSEAARHPRAYRLRLVAIAIAGDFALTVTELLPWAAPILIGVILIDLKLFYWLGAAAIVVLAWLLRPTFRFEGRELRIEEAPRLYEEIAALKQKLRVPGRMRVYLDGSFNASAAETRGLFGIAGTQCALTLGVPLLVALSREQVLSVMAHEFGHFSRRHGRLGHWLYRARAGWMQFARYVNDSDSAFDRAAAWYARQFVPFFSTRSFVHSRQCEYEADADAALAVGGRPFAEALTRVAVIARLWEERLPREVAAWQLQSPEPPGDFYQRFARCAEACAPADIQSWVEEALAAPSGWLDTHPGLAERLRSLKQEAAFATPPDRAAEVLLGAAWPEVLAQFNAQWVAEMRADWLVEHLRLKHIVQPLLATDERVARSWDDDLQLARAKALRAAQPAAGFAELRRLYECRPAHKRVRFAYAAALLSESDAAGVQLMETLAREDAAFRVPAFQRVLAYFERSGDTREIERWSAWLARASESLGEGVAGFIAKAEAGEARASSLPDAEKTVISEGTRRDPCVAHAWLVEGSVQFAYTSDRPTVPVVAQLLALAIDPKEARRLEQDEERIAERYQRLMRMLLPPEQVAAVRTYFTTEKLPALGPGGIV